jgi:CRP-like cAMP-binding protein
MPSLVALLADLPLFEDIPPVDVARLAGAFSLRTYGRGEPMEDGRRTLILSDGAARLVRSGPQRRVLGTGLLGEGSVFGLRPFAGEAPPEAAEALSQCRVVAVASTDLERIAGAHPAVAAALLQESAVRLAVTNDRLCELAFGSVPGRLASVLLEIGERFGRMTPIGVRIDLRLTHGQLAELVPTTRETLTKVVGWLRGEGLVVMTRRDIRILDPGGLSEVARGERVMPGRGVRALV